MHSRSGTVVAGCAFIAFAACSGAPEINLSPNNGPLLVRPHSTEAVLYSFKADHVDGKYSLAGVISVHGKLYGTTYTGGANGYGAVFEVTSAGAERVLHSFGRGHDGRTSYAGLTNANGTLYGTTYGGGAYGQGTVFAMDTAGVEKVLYSFAGTDGSAPHAGLTDVNGTLYGTTYGGGANGYGTVFSITTSGAEKVLYSFAGGSDGTYPYAGLVNVLGTLYGTTQKGGTRCTKYGGCGTVFKVTTDGTQAVLHSFGSGHDGAQPYAGLVDVNGTLYGTTYYGGATGFGTVYKVTTAGAERVLHSFGSGSIDGVYPSAGLTNVHGMLYGTTDYGGSTACGNAGGCGTLFRITTAGVETVLYSFAGGSDGNTPAASLTDVSGTLYGTTYKGGAHNRGTVYSLSGF
jgi:uncharacterized repeat protein (TIGR03803 family)